MNPFERTEKIRAWIKNLPYIFAPNILKKGTKIIHEDSNTENPDTFIEFRKNSYSVWLIKYLNSEGEVFERTHIGWHYWDNTFDNPEDKCNCSETKGEYHSCPYACEIDDDCSEDGCNCCDFCTQQCAENI